MSDAPDTPAEPPTVTEAQAPTVAHGAASTPAPADVPPAGPGPAFTPTDASGTISASLPGGAERPEIAVGAAFGGGLVLALILKRLASR